jgi:regulator of sirC expression with transglutaminase-like and TPR domain
VLRVDWRFRKNWESLAEVRTLDLRDVSQRRRGALVAIYRYIGENLKVGIGYNFTDFSDDLTDLGYDHKGVFINLTAIK